MNRSLMTAPFAEEELLTFEGRGKKMMTYIEDETVMDRLDAGYGYGNWQVQVDEARAEGVVKVRLGVRENVEWIWYEDFGYANREGGETLKEAVTDGIRRCGRMVGIARDLYRKATYEPGGTLGPKRPPTHDAPVQVGDDGLIGTVEMGKPPVDMQPRAQPEGGEAWGFALKDGNRRFQVLAKGLLADQLAMMPDLVGQRVKVFGAIEMVVWYKADKAMPPFPRVHATRVVGPDWELPEALPPIYEEPAEAESMPLFEEAV